MDMVAGISTHVFLQQRLHPGLLDAMRAGGARSIELFAARHHFDYMDRSAVRDLAVWFRSNDVMATMHQPLYTDAQWSRHVAPTINLIDVEKSRRIDAMDEVKRALEAAEMIPIEAAVLHLGMKDDKWNPRSLEHSLTAIEHLKAFAHPLGVKILLENIPNEVTMPEHLLEIVKVGHFDTVGFCLDLGHAHMFDPEGNRGIDEAFELLGKRVLQLHIHDNHGKKDEHLWPGGGTIDQASVARHTAKLGGGVRGTLEISYELGETSESVTKKIAAYLSDQERLAESEFDAAGRS